MAQLHAAAGVSLQTARTLVKVGYLDPDRFVAADIVVLKVAAALLDAPRPDGAARGASGDGVRERDLFALTLVRDFLARAAAGTPVPGAGHAVPEDAALVITGTGAVLAADTLELNAALHATRRLPRLVLPVGYWTLTHLGTVPPVAPSPAPASRRSAVHRPPTRTRSAGPTPTGPSPTGPSRPSEHTGPAPTGPHPDTQPADQQALDYRPAPGQNPEHHAPGADAHATGPVPHAPRAFTHRSPGARRSRAPVDLATAMADLLGRRPAQLAPSPEELTAPWDDQDPGQRGDATESSDASTNPVRPDDRAENPTGSGAGADPDAGPRGGRTGVGADPAGTDRRTPSPDVRAPAPDRRLAVDLPAWMLPPIDQPTQHQPAADRLEPGQPTPEQPASDQEDPMGLPPSPFAFEPAEVSIPAKDGTEADRLPDPFAALNASPTVGAPTANQPAPTSGTEQAAVSARAQFDASVDAAVQAALAATDTTSAPPTPQAPARSAPAVG